MIDDDEIVELGPAMDALSAKQRKFVMAMVGHPGITQAEAARQAGYSDIKDGAKVRGHLLAHSPAVQAAIREVAGLRLNSNSLLAADVLIEIANDPEASRKDRMKAAVYLLDRTGFGAAQTINVNKTLTDRTGKAVMERIKELAAKHGLDPMKLLAQEPQAVLDGEFTEVSDG